VSQGDISDHTEKVCLKPADPVRVYLVEDLVRLETRDEDLHSGIVHLSSIAPPPGGNERSKYRHVNPSKPVTGDTSPAATRTSVQQVASDEIIS
jgi:hypothetical protein